MTLDASIVGETDETLTVTLRGDRLAAFAEAIGETNAAYRDRAAARRAGYPDIPAPLTYPFSLGLARQRPLGFLEDRGIDLLKVLHGEQTFRYHGLMFAGQTVAVSRVVADYYERRGGALQFVVTETRIHTRSGDPVATSRETLVLTKTPPEPGVRHNAQQPPSAQNSPGAIPPVRPGVVTQAVLRDFAQASGDLNPVHTDPAAARAAGYADVFAHGMLSMAWLGRVLANWTRPEAVRTFAVRFHAIMPLHADPLCEGWLEDQGSDAGSSIGLRVSLQDGVTAVTGAARLDP